MKNMTKQIDAYKADLKQWREKQKPSARKPFSGKPMATKRSRK